MDLRTLKDIARFVSIIGLALGVFLLSVVLIGWLYDEKIERLLWWDLLFIVLNGSVYLATGKGRMKMDLKGSIIAVNLIWVLLGVAGAVPLMLYTHVGMADAFFESISGFTTTGATIYSDIESLPHFILYLRSLMHWLGGMGIIVLGVGLFSLINPNGSLALFKAESTGIKMEKVTPKIKDTALRLWGVYVLITLADMVALKLAGMDLFDALNHAFSTVSTGGFSTKNASLGAFDSPVIIWITTVFMILSGINFLAHLRFLTSRSTAGYRREEVLWYLAMFLLLSVMLSMTDIFIDQDSYMHALTHASFTIASVMTTTGFATLDYSLWGNLAISIVFVAMLLGGNAGSTAGGVKIIRYIVLFKNLGTQFTKIIHPKEVVSVFIDKERLSSHIVTSTTGFLFLFIITNMVVTLYLFARGFDAMTAVSTALATVGNIGPGFALTGPAENYAFFSDADKYILSFVMIAGRLEFYTVFLLFSRRFWHRF